MNTCIRLAKSGPFQYSSVQIDLPWDGPPLADALIDSDDLYTEEADGGVETDVHVTVCYGLTTEDAEAVRRVVEGFGPLEIEFGTTMVFTPADGACEAVVVEVVSERLRELHKLITSQLEYHSNYDEYRPHLTVAFVERGRGYQYEGRDTAITNVSIPAETVVFSARPMGMKTEISLMKETG